MKKASTLVLIFSFCSIFLASYSWALPPRKNKAQTKISNLENQLQYETLIRKDAQTKINNLENQLQYERQMKESLQTKISQLEKQFQADVQMRENAEKDKESAQQLTVKAENSRSLWMGISATIGLVCLLIGLSMWLKARRPAKIQCTGKSE